MAITFYGDTAEVAAELSDLEESDISELDKEIVNNIVDSEVGRPYGFGKGTETEYINIDNPYVNEILLKKIPIISVSSITDNSQINPIVLSENDYELDSDAGIIYLIQKSNPLFSSAFYFTKGIHSVKIIYEYGFNSIPSIIKTLSNLIMIKRKDLELQQAEADGNVKSIKIGNYSESRDLKFMNISSKYDGDILSLIKSAKKRYALGY